MADYAIHDTTLTGISNVIRKKDGTSALIDPADYADRINLMGMLEEKTVSGTIAHFDDGADGVPLKKCEITLPASLDGYSSVNVIHAGKNLWEFGDKTVDVVAYIMLYFTKPLPAGTYTVSCELTSTTTTCSFRFRKEDGSYLVQTSFTANAGRVSQTLTLPEPAYRVYLYSSTQAGGEVTTWKNVQIEVGATMTDFEPYTAPTTHTASLGRTIYGGTVDVVAGSGENTEKGKWLSELTWTQNASYPHIFNGEGFTDRKKNFNWDNTTCLSDRYTGYTSSSIVTQSSGIALGTGATSTRIYVSDDRFETVADFVASLQTDDSFVVLPLENPETFTFTPITPTPETALGVNNFWSDSGDSEVTYRGQGTVYQYPEGEGVSF